MYFPAICTVTSEKHLLSSFACSLMDSGSMHGELSVGQSPLTELLGSLLSSSAARCRPMNSTIPPAASVPAVSTWKSLSWPQRRAGRRSDAGLLRRPSHPNWNDSRTCAQHCPRHCGRQGCTLLDVAGPAQRPVLLAVPSPKLQIEHCRETPQPQKPQTAL